MVEQKTETPAKGSKKIKNEESYTSWQPYVPQNLSSNSSLPILPGSFSLYSGENKVGGLIDKNSSKRNVPLHSYDAKESVKQLKDNKGRQSVPRSLGSITFFGQAKPSAAEDHLPRSIAES